MAKKHEQLFILVYFLNVYKSVNIPTTKWIRYIMLNKFIVDPMLLQQTKSITVDCGNIIFLKWSFNHLLIAYSSMRDILHIIVTKFNSSKIDTVDSFVRNLIFAPGSLGKYPLSKKYIWLPFISVGVKINKLLIFSRQALFVSVKILPITARCWV